MLISSSRPLSRGSEAPQSQASGQLASQKVPHVPRAQEHGTASASPQGLVYHTDIALWFS